MTAAVHAAAASVPGLAGLVPGGPAARLAAGLAPEFLAGIGWDPSARVIAPLPGHRLLHDDAASRGCARGGDVTGCAVPGCGRRETAPGRVLCREHRRQQRIAGGLPLGQFLALPQTVPLPATGPCQVPACLRDRTSRTRYCEAHQYRLRMARLEAGRGFSEERWRVAASPVPAGGQVSLRGLPELVAVEILYGLQQRTGAGFATRLHVLRAAAEELRRSGAVSILAAGELPGPMGRQKRAILGSLGRYVRGGLGDTRAECAEDVWDLSVFGASRGKLSFTAISQGWLRQAAKRWAADDLPRHRGACPHSRVQHIINAVARLSAHLRVTRGDNGEHPGALGRDDIESFLHRLAYLESSGQISRDGRVRICQDLRRMLDRVRALGLVAPAQPAAGLGTDFVLSTGDVPRAPEPPEPSRDLPPEIMRALSAQLSDLERGSCGQEIRAGTELLMDTGRRPDEICRLPFDCLALDADGSPVLCYDNHKGARAGRRLPIGQATASVITGQQQRVRARFPATPAARLVLLPTVMGNPEGTRPISAASLIQRHRDWIGRMAALTLADGTGFDKAKIVPYCYRHTYAQRHADAGIAPDVLRDLMNHRSINATLRYYRIGEDRRRDAVDKVTAMAFDRHGNRVWRDVRALLDADHARYGIGEVAVPYGRCTEPSNVRAGGGACPIRFRCAGCDHFRTDVSYLPDLTAYLDDLLRTRERLAAAIDGVDDWARADATPAQEEITRIRGLIARVKGDLAELSGTERAAIDDAVTTVRKHRAVTLGMPAHRPAPAPATATQVPA
ncbi:MAG: tyrosine-type recombinase/integrase [Streptosporangiaceae bacterium]